MSVVLRCPTCGTTQAHAGECDACSEGEVRYFCSNHEEGIWLDTPICSRCGARFGEAAAGRGVPPAGSGPTRPAGAPDFRPPRARGVPERPLEAGSGAAPPDSRGSEDPVEPDVLPRTPLEELLAEISGARAHSRRPYEAEEVTWAEPREPRARRPGIPFAGCLLRFLGLIFLLIAALVLFMFLLFGGFIVG